MFEDLKFEGEAGYDPEKDTKLTETLNEDNMAIIVQTIFRKA
jgi:hypothetical protein